MTLKELFVNNQGRKISKYDHYLDIYEQYFQKFVGKKPCVLEIGVDDGGSLKMWQDYFGKDANIFGLDIKDCQHLSEPGIHVFCGDQNDPVVLRDIVSLIPQIDILIDDGSHIQGHIKTTFEVLYPFIKDGGIYTCEDLHTAYYQQFDGGYHAPGSFIEYAKNLIDKMHAWAAEDAAVNPITEFTRNTFGIHFYCNLLIIEKRNVVELLHSPRMTGKGFNNVLGR